MSRVSPSATTSGGSVGCVRSRSNRCGVPPSAIQRPSGDGATLLDRLVERELAGRAAREIEPPHRVSRIGPVRDRPRDLEPRDRASAVITSRCAARCDVDERQRGCRETTRPCARRRRSAREHGRLRHRRPCGWCGGRGRRSARSRRRRPRARAGRRGRARATACARDAGSANATPWARAAAATIARARATRCDGRERLDERDRARRIVARPCARGGERELAGKLLGRAGALWPRRPFAARPRSARSSSARSRLATIRSIANVPPISSASAAPRGDRRRARGCLRTKRTSRSRARVVVRRDQLAGEEPLQILGERAGIGIALRAVVGERLVDDRRQLGRRRRAPARAAASAGRWPRHASSRSRPSRDAAAGARAGDTASRRARRRRSARRPARRAAARAP